MKNIIFAFFLGCLTLPMYAQSDWISGRDISPRIEQGAVYSIQVGAYANKDNAVHAFNLLRSKGFNPIYEKYKNYQRVLLTGVKAIDVQKFVRDIKSLGFREVIVREKAGVVYADFPKINGQSLQYPQSHFNGSRYFYIENMYTKQKALVQVVDSAGTNANVYYDFTFYDGDETYWREYSKTIARIIAEYFSERR